MTRRAVLTAVADGVRTITLNRPERLNAINTELLTDLAAALEEASGDPATRAVVLTGAGRAFCAGDDLKEFGEQARTRDEARGHIERIQRITRLIVGSDRIVVAAVKGWAVGGGFEWTINADLVLMADDTRCFFPELSLGLFVTGGVTYLLPRLVGRQRALDLLLFGERIDARRALDLGIAWRVVPADRLPDEAGAVAGKIAALPAARVRDLKRALNEARDLDSAMALETAATVDAFLDPEAAARVARFGQG
jgi:enoyl-CoA hydratase/carnithine racemase